jgi:hypothetical protein
MMSHMQPWRANDRLLGQANFRSKETLALPHTAEAIAKEINREST